MDTCFLFAKHLTENACLFLKLSQHGDLLVHPALLPFDDIRTQQQECKTIVVEDSQNTSLLSVELPWLAERKARLAIPYALEENLAQPVDTLHFAFDKTRYYDKQYLVVVIAAERMQALMQCLSNERINYDLITTDWFALAPQEMVVTESTVLVHHNDFKGAFSEDLASKYLANHPLSQPLLFDDSTLIPACDTPKKQGLSFTWIANKLLKSKPLNLCQGGMQHGNFIESIKKRYYLAAGLCCVWLLSIVLVKAITLHTLHNKIAHVDAEIAVIYHAFFPNATQVISPKFRIQNLLADAASHAEQHFWFVINQFAKELKNNPLAIEQLRYQNQTLQVTLVSPDFASVDRLKKALQQSRLKIKQTQASTRGQQVVTTLELA